MTLASIRHKGLVVCPHRQMMADIGPLLSAATPLAPLRRLSAYPDRKQLAEALAGFEARLCFLDFSSSEQNGFQTLELLHAANPHMAVIALMSGANPDLVLRCMRAGASAFIVLPFTGEQIESALESAVRRLPGAYGVTAVGKVIGVMPCKGGAGATTLACNLAWQFNRQGAERVLLCDLDPLTGTLSFMLKLTPTFTFMDILQRAGTLDDDVWKQMVTRSAGVDVLLSPDRMLDPATELMPPDSLAEFAAGMYDAMVFDMGGPYGIWNLSVARMCDEVAMVCTNELMSLHAASRAVLWLETHGVGRDRIRMIVNRYAKDAGLQSERIPEALGVPVSQVIPADADAVARSLMEGKPIAPSTSYGKALAELAGQLLQKSAGTAAAQQQKKSGGRLLTSLFSRS